MVPKTNHINISHCSVFGPHQKAKLPAPESHMALVLVHLNKGGKNMCFSKYRARKQAKKRKQECMARVYPPGYSTEPKRQPNPDYKLQTTKKELIQCLITYDHISEHDAEYRATNMINWIPQGLT